MSRHAPTSLLAFCVLAALSFALAPPATALDNANEKADDTAQSATADASSDTSEATEQKPEKQSETTESVQEDVEKSAKVDADEKKQTLVKEAVSAVEMRFVIRSNSAKHLVTSPRKSLMRSTTSLRKSK